jgi:hypothetical protein
MATLFSTLGKLAKDVKAINKQMDKARTMALNEAGKAGKTEAARAIAKQYVLTQAEIKQTLSIELNPAQKYVDIKSNGKRFPLIRFAEKKVSMREITRRAKAGEIDKYKLRHGGVVAKNMRVRVKIRKGHTTTLKHAFYAVMPNGHVGIYERAAKGRLPIKEMAGVAVPQLFTQKDVKKAVLERATEVYYARFKHHIERFKG